MGLATGLVVSVGHSRVNEQMAVLGTSIAQGRQAHVTVNGNGGRVKRQPSADGLMVCGADCTGYSKDG